MLGYWQNVFCRKIKFIFLNDLNFTGAQDTGTGAKTERPFNNPSSSQKGNLATGVGGTFAGADKFLGSVSSLI